MDDKVKALKDTIKNGTYDWNYAVETTAEKLVLLTELEAW